MTTSKEEPNNPTVEDLRELLGIKYAFEVSHYDEVFPGIFLGDMKTAKNLLKLEELKITHVLNAAHSSSPFTDSDTSEVYYEQRNFPCKFFGIPAMDIPIFKMNEYFDTGADFIEEALQSNGRVFAHCQIGVSRSATIVIAYLMIKQKMTAIEAVRVLREKRAIYPNDGFLQQIVDLDHRLKHPSNFLVRRFSLISKALKTQSKINYGGKPRKFSLF